MTQRGRLVLEHSSSLFLVKGNFKEGCGGEGQGSSLGLMESSQNVPSYCLQQNTVFLYSLLPINFAEKWIGSVFTPFSVPLSPQAAEQRDEQVPVSSGLILLPASNPQAETNPMMSLDSVKRAGGDLAVTRAVPLPGHHQLPHRRRCLVPFHLTREVASPEYIDRMQGAGLFALGVHDLLPMASAAALALTARAGLTPAPPLHEL